ncbi:ATP-dependent metallopeptidase FtsH/Yme1/Tma family protein [Mycolicibacterium poriferae]|uniref:ATP-dependent metallopeptidase FtsH/Yme1/Tma family protein n=1 Tax=Mycolicibacterium poriferae TaxID=39694 RepID=UPI00321974FB
MNRKNVIRTLTVIAVVLLLGWLFFRISDDTREYTNVDTSVAVAQINDDNVTSAQIDDREQQLRLELKNGNSDTEDSTKIITKYPTGYGVTLFEQLSAKGAKINTVVNQSSMLGTLLIYMLPLLLLGLGWLIFKRRVKGAYFAILTQALAVVFATLLVATIKETGGFNGLNQFTLFFGYNLYDPVNKQMVYSIAAGLLIGCLVVVWQLYRSRFGELLVATRDAEERVRFLGHDPANIKLVAFVIAAVMASIGGAMFAPIAGIISPSDVDATASIFLIAGVALGGRALLLGPALGALTVGFGRTYLSEQFPTQWTYFLGLLFVLVILLLPRGVGDLPRLVRARFGRSAA